MSTKSKILVTILKELWLWCIDREITITAQHLPGLENVRADFMSRHLSDRSDWISPHIFNVLNQRWGPFNIDLFATRLAGVDALVQDWSQVNGYANPPWCLIGRTLHKVSAQRVTVTLITPVWPSQPWYPTRLLSLLVDFPLLLPWEPQTIIPPQNCKNTIQHCYPQIATWKVSGNNCLQEGFQERLQSSYSCPGGPRQIPATTQHGKSGQSGVTVELKVPFRHLLDPSGHWMCTGQQYRPHTSQWMGFLLDNTLWFPDCSKEYSTLDPLSQNIMRYGM